MMISRVEHLCSVVKLDMLPHIIQVHLEMWALKRLQSQQARCNAQQNDTGQIGAIKHNSGAAWVHVTCRCWLTRCWMAT